MGRGEAATKKVVGLDEWEKKLKGVVVRKEDMNKLIMNFLVVEGYVEAAQMFQAESGTEPGVDLASIADRTAIRKAVQEGNIENAIERTNDLNPEILEERTQVLFHLQQQRLIELIRSGNVEEALDFAQEYLAPQGAENSAFLEELERTVTLLAFEDTANSPVGDLLLPSQRHKTASELNAAILSSKCQEKEPRLPILLKMMLWAQKQLDDKLAYPRITDIVTAKLEPPAIAESS
mmetsp:Transcript_48199/g.92132  ORF Transcript_48199/g.92132 Transcript_48199/m.92132 type:complete len:235 (-) Transcript_48199:433-1137(-)